MDFFERTGTLALESRLRRLTAQLTEDSAKIYGLYPMDFSPKWLPVLFVLYHQGTRSIAEISGEIGHSRPSVTKIVKEMYTAGWVREHPGPKDGPTQVVELSERGKKDADTILQVLGADIQSALKGLMADATHDLWEAIAEWEFLLEQKSLFDRVRERKKVREGREIEIVAYQPKYHAAFKALNQEWITTHFEMEEADHRALDDPEGHILKKGGSILVALYRGEPVGVCALLKMDDPRFDFEMAKMAVSPKARGKHIGWLLGQAIIETARGAGANNIYLETNTLLRPAVNLYHKLGFHKIEGHPTPYRRCDLQMELILDPA